MRTSSAAWATRLPFGWATVPSTVRRVGDSPTIGAGRKAARSNPSLLRHRTSESGYILLAILIMATLLAIAAAAAVPAIKTQIRRDRELELQHRGNEYIKAIQKYYRKFGRYPNSIDQLVSTSNQRFLRKRYLDPLTGKDDWRIIHLGEAKFPPKIKAPGGAAVGQQIGQNIGASIGSSIGTTLGGNSQNSPSSFGNSSSFGNNSSSPALNSSSGPQPVGGVGLASAPGGATSNTGPSGSFSLGSSSGVGQAGLPIIGVAIPSTEKSLRVYNERQQYNEWEFIYDPRLEALAGAAGGGTGNFNSQGATGAAGTNGNTFQITPFNSGNPTAPPSQPPTAAPNPQQ